MFVLMSPSWMRTLPSASFSWSLVVIHQASEATHQSSDTVHSRQYYYEGRSGRPTPLDQWPLHCLVRTRAVLAD